MADLLAQMTKDLPGDGYAYLREENMWRQTREGVAHGVGWAVFIRRDEHVFDGVLGFWSPETRHLAEEARDRYNVSVFAAGHRPPNIR